MARADLHVHSRYSQDGDEWALRALGVRESYTEIEEVYRLAKLRKMDFVALTDHNTIEGAIALAERHPEDTLVGCEFSVFFPEDHCKVHLLVYGLTQGQFEKIMSVRSDIYKVREYLVAEKLAYSVAHATLSLNGKLEAEVLEKLILLFDVFESVNGAHSASHNKGWAEVLDKLMPEDVERLSAKYGIRPLGKDSWNKGLTGGSDDHAGLFIGETFTVAPCRTREEFLQSLKEKKTFGAGRHHDYRSMALSLLLIGGHVWGDLSGNRWAPLIAREIRSVLNGHRGMRDWSLRVFAWMLKISGKPFLKAFGDFLAVLLRRFRQAPSMKVSERVDFTYRQFSLTIDQLVRYAVASFGGIHRGRNFSAIKKGLVAAAFLSAPTLASLKVLYHGRDLAGKVRLGAGGVESLETSRRKNVLWFSDTLRTRRGIRKFSEVWDPRDGTRLRCAVCTLSRGVSEMPEALSIPVSGVLRKKLLGFSWLRIPSVLEGLARIEAWAPDEIVIGTPGPLGILGLIAARLLNLKCFYAFAPEIIKASFHGEDTEEKGVMMHWLKVFCDLTDGVYALSRSGGQGSPGQKRFAEPESFECV